MCKRSFLVAAALAKDNENHDQSSIVPATGWDFTGVPGQEPVNAEDSNRQSRCPATQHWKKDSAVPSITVKSHNNTWS